MLVVETALTVANMMKFLNFGSDVIGLDVGASALKLLKGRLNKNKFEVSEMSTIPLGRGAKDVHGVQNISMVSKAIVEALDECGLNKKIKIASSVRGAGVITKRITIPKVPKREIEDQVKWEANQVFSQDADSIIVEHVLLGEGANVPGAPEGTKGWDLLLVGVRYALVDQLKLTIEKTPVDLKCVDVDAFVTGDFLDTVLDLPKNEPIALVDIGATGTQFCVRYNGSVVYIREFETGGQHFVDMVSQTLGLTLEDAEAIILQDGSAIPQEAREALNSVFVNWKNELQQCEDIFVSQNHSDALISRWYLYGGGVLVPGLLESLSNERIASKVERLDAESIFVAKGKNVNAETLRQWSPRLISAAGLCGRG